MFQNLLKLMVPLSKYNVLKIKVIFWYFKQEYVCSVFSKNVVTRPKCVSNKQPIKSVNSNCMIRKNVRNRFDCAMISFENHH